MSFIEEFFRALFSPIDDERKPRRRRRGSSADTPASHYRSREHLLTQTEARFFDQLRQILPDQIHVCSKVRLSDVLDPFDNSIAQKHLDFVLCSYPSLTILGAIELDDPSHERADRQDRDAFVEAAMLAANVPLVRIPARRAYHRETLAKALAPILAPAR